MGDEGAGADNEDADGSIAEAAEEEEERTQPRRGFQRLPPPAARSK